MIKEFAKTILFTGAGFTKNFGGLLAREMWSKIFNHKQVQSRPQLKKLLLDDYDYESIYYKVIDGNFKDDEKNAIAEAIFQAYETLDDIVRQWIFPSNSPYSVNIYGVNKMIERFAGDQQQLGFFFTLNQDLFIERHFNTITKTLSYPGVARIPNSHKTINGLPLDNQDYVMLPTKEEVESKLSTQFYKNTLHYIKLHGSFGWISSDGAKRLVIGKNKKDQIAREPLLSSYFDLFKKVLLIEQRRLFIIGYGFNDDHINKVIADAVTQHKLKFYILSPKDQSHFIKEIRKVAHGEEMLNGLSGYFPYTLLETFPSDQSESHAWKEIKERYFMN